MQTIRRSADRGHADHGWLDSRHTFSFAAYFDPDHMGFRSLRVINEDRVAPGHGFGAHPHRDMEILSYVLEGRLEHRDSMGNGSILEAGSVQRMTAGRGVVHSERNASPDEPVHFLQIWIEPERAGLEPSYQEAKLDSAAPRGLVLLASGGDDAALRIHQDARIWSGVLAAGESASHELAPGRGAWLQVVRGALRLGDDTLTTGDAAAVTEVERIEIEATADSEILLFDLA